MKPQELGILESNIKKNATIPVDCWLNRKTCVWNRFKNQLAIKQERIDIEKFIEANILSSTPTMNVFNEI